MFAYENIAFIFQIFCGLLMKKFAQNFPSYFRLEVSEKPQKVQKKIVPYKQKEKCPNYARLQILVTSERCRNATSIISIIHGNLLTYYLKPDSKLDKAAAFF